MSPQQVQPQAQPQAQDPNAKINEITSDPDFQKLSDSDQKGVILHLTFQRNTVPSFTQPPAANISGLTRANTLDPLLDNLRPILSSAAALAATPGDALTAGIPLASAGAYTGMDALLQHLRSTPAPGILSSATGMKPGGVAATLTNTVEQGVTGKLFEGGTSALFKLKNMLYGAAAPVVQDLLPTTSQAAKAAAADIGETSWFKNPRDAWNKAKLNILGSSSKALEDLNLSSKQAALNRTAGQGFTEQLQVAKDSDFIFSRNPNTMLDIVKSYDPELESFKTIDNVIKDPELLKSTLARAQTNGVGDNLRKSLQGYQFMKMMEDASTYGEESSGYVNHVTKINSQKISDVWLDPKMQDSLDTLYSAKNRSDMTQFFKNIALTQDKMTTIPIARNLIMVHGGIALAGGVGSAILTGSIPEGLAGGALTGGASILLSAQTVGKLLTSPNTARLLVAMAGGEALGVSDQYAARAIARVLQGCTIALANANGSRKPVIVSGNKLISVDSGSGSSINSPQSGLSVVPQTVGH